MGYFSRLASELADCDLKNKSGNQLIDVDTDSEIWPLFENSVHYSPREIILSETSRQHCKLTVDEINAIIDGNESSPYWESATCKMAIASVQVELPAQKRK